MSLDNARRELYYWQHSDNPSNFSALLFVLFTKADLNNRSRLNQAFPEYSQAFNEWYNAKDPDILFKEWGF